MRPSRRVGILDLLTTPARGWSEAAYHLAMTKQYAGVTPQVIAVWCREFGHRTFYATYYGYGDPRDLLPDDLDVLFIASYTQVSALAYALAKLYRARGTRTVIGGPHAKAFPVDCLRFFDVVVGECDRPLIADIVNDAYDPGSLASSREPFSEMPTVEERMPEIRASAFAGGRRPFAATTIPLLASTGCPYTCDFCIDWNRPYRPFATERLAADLQYVARHLRGVMVGFHDPNFGVRFDDVLGAMETVPPRDRPPYLMEASLSVLRGERIRRLQQTNCVSVAPGIESWSGYSAKTGAARLTGAEKLEHLVEHFRQLHDAVPYLQANFLFGLDCDAGDLPIRLTKEFMSRTPFVWPVVNIPYPFGGTPLFERLREGRLLESLPFSFYYSPYLATIPRHYSALAYYEKLIELFEHFTTPGMLVRRVRTTRRPFVALIHVVRTRVKRGRLRALRRLRDRLASDAAFRAFHEGGTRTLPEFYHVEYERLLGRFAPLMTRDDRTPRFA